MSSVQESTPLRTPESSRIGARRVVERANEDEDDDDDADDDNNHLDDNSDGELSDSFEEQEFRDAQSQLFFIFPELEESVSRSSSVRRRPASQFLQTPNSVAMERQTGVLWKRRDVFKNRWRPRWFALNPGQGVLTYYLLTSPTGIDGTTSTSTATADTTTATPLTDAITPPRGGSSSIRNRTSSWDSGISAVSENTVDYDVVPRGTIYLLGCTVSINEALSKPHANLYAFSIRPPVHSEPSIHLAARTAELREIWVDRIDRVCRVGSPRGDETNVDVDAPTPTTSQRSSSRQPTLVSATPMFDHRSGTGTGTAASMPSALRSRTSTPGLPRRRLGDALSLEVDETNDGGASGSGSSPLRPNGSVFGSIADHLEQRDTWTALASPASTYAAVPNGLTTRIQQTLNEYLKLCNDNGVLEQSDWKQLSTSEGATHKAYQRLDAQGRATIKSVATLNHPPKQVFGLLIDIARRSQFETKVRTSERIKEMNPHTFLDYYAYNAVWPTQAREFTVVTHWEVVGKGDDRAIAIVSFSCPEASELRSVQANHVRADLFVSMYLLQPVTTSTQQHDAIEQCKFTRFLSFDLGGNVSKHLSNVISTQQAHIPTVIADFLLRNEPDVESRYRGILTNETVVTTVIRHLSRNGGASSMVPSPQMIRPPSPQSTDGSSDQTDLAEKFVPRTARLPAIESQAVLLLAPVVVYWLMVRSHVQGAALVFTLAAYLAVRQVVLWHVGDAVPSSDEQMLLGPVTCRFAVELKGVLRFIANKKEERDEWKNGNADISVVHIVASALARALVKEPALRSRRVSIPWLLINRVVDTRMEPVDVSISENGSGLITLNGVESLTIQNIANGHAAAEEQTNATKGVGQCLVLSSSNSGETEMVTDAAPVHENVSVVAILGGVFLEHEKKGKPRPCLSMSLTITRQLQADIITCRRFAGEVRKYLAFPEMCDAE